MSESDAGLIPLEGGDGAALALPSDMVMPRSGEPAPVAVEPEPEPVAAEPAPEPVAAAEPDGDDDGLGNVEAELEKQAHGDPQKAGIFNELKATRRLVKDLKKENAAGRDIARRLMARPDLVHLLETGQAIPAAELRELRTPVAAAPAVPVIPVDSAQDVADLELIAQTNGLYKQDGSGSLDIDAAKRVRDFVKRTADAAVAERMKPVEQRLVLADAHAAMTEAMAAANTLGIDAAVAKTALDSLYQENPEYLRDPQTVSAALFAAEGAASIQRRRNAPPPPPPAPPMRELVSPIVHPILREQSTVQGKPTLEVSNALKSVMNSHGIGRKSVEGTLSRLDSHDPKANFVLED